MSQSTIQNTVQRWANEVGKAHYWDALKNVTIHENQVFLKKLSPFDHLHLILAVLPENKDEESIRTLANRFYNESQRCTEQEISSLNVTHVDAIGKLSAEILEVWK